MDISEKKLVIIEQKKIQFQRRSKGHIYVQREEPSGLESIKVKKTKKYSTEKYCLYCRFNKMKWNINRRKVHFDLRPCLSELK